MKPDLRFRVIRLLTLAVIAGVLTASSAFGVFLEKRFTVCQDQGRDVLCDSYVVQKDDFVTKLFKQRGEISGQDMPAFLEIFKRLNPHIRNVDLIYPGQWILIPLKIIPPDTLAGQSTGTVTIPLITITNVPQKLQRNAVEHIVVAGDCVSGLIAGRFGDYRSQAYKEAIEIFRYLNPDIKDLNRIRIGQKINLPEPSIRGQAWYPALFDEAGQIVVAEENEGQKKEEEKKQAEPEKVVPAMKPVAQKPAEEKPEPEKPLPKPLVQIPPAASDAQGPTVFEKAAQILHADLMDRGEYFFPREGGDDFRLALSETPVMTIDSGRRVLFIRENRISNYDQAVIKRFWKNLVVVRIMESPSLRDLLTPLCPVLYKGGCRNSLSLKDAGVFTTIRGDYIYDSPDRGRKVCLTLIADRKQATPAAMRRYLDDKNIHVAEWIDTEAFFGQAAGGERDPGGNSGVPVITASEPEKFIEGFAAALGFGYQKNVEVSFSYAGFQVKTLSNLLTAPSGRRSLIDYGELYGDAVESMETTGFYVVQIKKREDYMGMAKDLLNGLSIPFEENPIFWAADRPRINNTSMQVPGLSISLEKAGQKKVFITFERVPEKLIPFFTQAGIRVVRVRR